MGKIYNGAASEYEMPREPKLYENENTLPKTTCNIPMPPVKPLKKDSIGNKVCDTCCKADVCMYKGETAKAFTDIKDITDRVNVFVNVNIQCKNWAEQVVNVR